MIKISKLIHDYIQRDEEGNPSGTIRAINDISLDVEPGQFIAILGHNGSGKSTLAKMLNGIILPDDGDIIIDGMNTKSPEDIWKILGDPTDGGHGLSESRQPDHRTGCRGRRRVRP